uniref:Uncharacterized protein n=1 Tax=Rhipicephalus microplus TaxID=6941 RepID=A0A6M2D8C8_RHIMP
MGRLIELMSQVLHCVVHIHSYIIFFFRFTGVSFTGFSMALSDVGLQIVLPRETDLTSVTDKRPFFGMCAHVSVKVSRLSEFSSAHAALIGLRAGMSAVVSLELTRISKRRTAHLADVFVVDDVIVKMFAKLCHTREDLLAKVTHPRCDIVLAFLQLGRLFCALCWKSVKMLRCVGLVCAVQCAASLCKCLEKMLKFFIFHIRASTCESWRGAH